MQTRRPFAYLKDNIVFNGDLGGMPVLTLHTTGDGLVANQDEQAYRSVVQDAKDSQLLRQVFVHRAGHCTFTPAETISAFQALVACVETGKWNTDPATLEAAAAALGPTYNSAPPSFVDFEPTPFLRPYDFGTHSASAANRSRHVLRSSPDADRRPRVESNDRPEPDLHEAVLRIQHPNRLPTAGAGANQLGRSGADKGRQCATLEQRLPQRS